MIEETCQGENTEEIIAAPSQEKSSENNEKQTKKQKPNTKKDWDGHLKSIWRLSWKFN